MKLKLLSLIIISFGIYGFSKEFSDTVVPELVYDTSSLDTDRIVKIGVLFKIKPNWHIYWKNSGDSGLPTHLEFILPEGFNAGEINWPLPHAYKRSGNILDYGYADEVLLWSDVKAPPDFTINSGFPVTVQAKWVSCEEICIPGKAVLSSNIDFNVNNRKLFEKWTKNLPSELSNNINLEVRSKNSNETSVQYIIVINHRGLASEFKLFPNPEKALEIESISYKNQDENISEIIFTATVYPGQKIDSEHLNTVIAYSDNNNQPKGFEYRVNISGLLGKN